MIPVLLAGAGIFASVVGVGGHLSAKETNEKAQSVSREARNIYDKAKTSLENAQSRTETALLKFGKSKVRVLDTSMKRFLNSYDKIKEVVVSDSIGLNELSSFHLDKQDEIQLREMTDIYSETISSGATGAAAGAIIALAASGDLILVTDGLALAGSCLAVGEVGAAAGIAGSALSFGAAMTPLSAIAAPVILFTGISASMKADENLEKAQAMRAEAELAVEKMKVSETLCDAISERSDMLNDTLLEVNSLFSRGAAMMEKLVNKKEQELAKEKLSESDFSNEDINLIAVTRSLAGAVKAIIDSPIINEKGGVTDQSRELLDKTYKSIPEFNKVVENLEFSKYLI